MITDVPVPLIWENDGLHCKDKSPAQVQDGSKKKIKKILYLLNTYQVPLLTYWIFFPIRNPQLLTLSLPDNSDKRCNQFNCYRNKMARTDGAKILSIFIKMYD